MISFATIDDIEDIMDFIDREWRKGHILARDRVFFEWMYLRDDKVNFIVSRNNNVIDGILGFIPFDDDNTQIALAVWKALKSASGMTGMLMLSFLEKELKPKVIATPGINPKTTTAIYKYFKYDVGKMKHYYRLADISDFYIPIIKDDIIIKPAIKTSATVKRIHSYEDYEKAGIVLDDNAIKKDGSYIDRRYFKHPVFEYQHYIVEKDNKKLDVVMREQEIDGYKCLKLIDLLGEYGLLVDFTFELDKILIDENYEFVDCYVSGVEAEIWKNAGWEDVDNTKNIIPNYFAPFERVNVDLYYSCKPQGFVMLRGDGDQDRPN